MTAIVNYRKFSMHVFGETCHFPLMGPPTRVGISGSNSLGSSGVLMEGTITILSLQEQRRDHHQEQLDHPPAHWTVQSSGPRTLGGPIRLKRVWIHFPINITMRFVPGSNIINFESWIKMVFSKLWFSWYLILYSRSYEICGTSIMEPLISITSCHQFLGRLDRLKRHVHEEVQEARGFMDLLDDYQSDITMENSEGCDSTVNSQAGLNGPNVMILPFVSSHGPADFMLQPVSFRVMGSLSGVTAGLLPMVLAVVPTI
ncbi:uncharacterized protein F5891DRAFT_1174718 [Suillus fuscotomentosus]|uniref:Uncharacterized protein n=1 Tax=Suillus fuscotomentosus TaxID=1912939 RepID=A0AAD4HI60_9AGAM|nr:uncharacterized protein F5891DRAFT_1174718 [Suillus fuscotomentosus]KAG1897387.1 hypothetical protein F5891DRAFT_1174718 [Suillus fuscotomentosus]